MTELKSNKTVCSNLLVAVGMGDVQAIADSYADDGYCETMGRTLISGRHSKEMVAAAADRILDMFPKGITFDVLNITAEDDRVTIEAVSHGDHVSGVHYSNHYHFFFKLRDHKIVAMKEFMDTELVTEVLCGGQRPEPGRP